MKCRVNGILFYRSCLCCGLVVRIHFSSSCGYTLVDVGVWLVLVFLTVAYPTVPPEKKNFSFLQKVHFGSAPPPPPPQASCTHASTESTHLIPSNEAHVTFYTYYQNTAKRKLPHTVLLKSKAIDSPLPKQYITLPLAPLKSTHNTQFRCNLQHALINHSFLIAQKEEELKGSHLSKHSNK
jgi:hypothetical protein